MSTKSLLISVLNWLRAGYPEGSRAPIRVPLLALLQATPLTEEQVAEVVRNIAEAAAPADIDDPIERDDIAEFIAEVAHHDAGPENIQRVAGQTGRRGLAAGRRRPARPTPTPTRGPDNA